MKKKRILNIVAGLLGNIVEHHDKALFALLAPFIGPLFFEPTDPISALIKTYFILFIGMLMRPMGALAYGYIADTYGRKNALSWSIIGMSLATGAMGFLPTYAQAGIGAPIALALARILQNFFAAGETNGAAIFVLEHSSEKKQPFISSLIETSTMLGVLLASLEIMLFSYFDILITHWRWLMWVGCAAGMIGIVLRAYCTESEDFTSEQDNERLTIKAFFMSLTQEFRPLTCITIAAGFSSCTYIMSMTFITAFLLLTSPMTTFELTSSNTSLMLFDLALLPVFGYIAIKIPKEKIMITAAGFTAVLAIPLFQNLENASLITITTVRSIIMVLGVSFAAPFRLWAKELVPVKRRCTIVNLGCSLADILIEGPAAIVSLWLFKTTGWIAAPGIYLAAVALLTVWALRLAQQSKIVPVPEITH